MKVSQEGIEWVKSQPGKVRKIKRWLGRTWDCPFDVESYTGRKTKIYCHGVCSRIWPGLKMNFSCREINCPCHEYEGEEVIEIAKQIVGEEATDVRKIPTEEKSHT